MGGFSIRGHCYSTHKTWETGVELFIDTLSGSRLRMRWTPDMLAKALFSFFSPYSSISFKQWVFSETMTSEPRRAREKGREERLKAYRWDGQDRVKVMDSGVRPLEIRCSNSYDYFSPLGLGFPQVHVKYMRWQETTGTCYHIVG